MGLASLLSDLSRYEEAASELREILALPSGIGDDHVEDALQRKAASTLFRTQAAICAWDTFIEDSAGLADMVRDDLESNASQQSIHTRRSCGLVCRYKILVR